MAVLKYHRESGYKVIEESLRRLGRKYVHRNAPCSFASGGDISMSMVAHDECIHLSIRYYSTGDIMYTFLDRQFGPRVIDRPGAGAMRVNRCHIYGRHVTRQEWSDWHQANRELPLPSVLVKSAAKLG